MALHLNWDGNQNNGIIFNSTYTNGALFTGITNKPKLSFTFDSMQYTEVFPNELNWVEVSGIKKVMTAAQESEVAKVATSWVQPLGQEGNPSFPQKVTTKLQNIETDYDNANEADIAYMNTTFQADYNSQNLIIGALSAGSVPSNFYWLDKNNKQIAMTYAQLQGLSKLLLARTQTNFTKLQTLKTQIKAATTQTALDKIVW